MTTPPLAKPRGALFSKPNSILTIVSAAHAVNHAYSTLMPLIYPLVVAELKLSYSQIGLLVGIASATSGLLQMSFSYLRVCESILVIVAWCKKNRFVIHSAHKGESSCASQKLP